MMDEPRQERTVCDVGRELRIYTQDGMLLADTLDAIDGECPISTPASKRTYLLRVYENACRIVIMDGESYSESGVSTLHVEDFRLNDCGDFRSARVVATETFPGSAAQKWYSQENRGW